MRPGLPDAWRVLTPALLGRKPEQNVPPTFQLAESVVAAMGTAGLASGSVCGFGLGAMVALQLAVDHPDRVERLFLITRQVRLSPILLSLPAVVLRLLPAAAVQRLGAASDQVLALLDEVRPIDVAPLAPKVDVPALVLCGARDIVNRRASAELARMLPHAELQLLPQAGPGWLADRPELLTEALVRSVRPN
jgi:3-oxoadipate enol-lactonase